jgi:NAD(P)-dependent dehydrogenase (short-subunit alcohol dehydrogenase family)
MKYDARNVIVTGATGAIGWAVARQIVGLDGFHVVLAARDALKAELAFQRIHEAAGCIDMTYELVDLSRPGSVRAFAARWDKPLYALVNNAVTAPRQRMETPEGLELQFATNVLGYFWMTSLFKRHLMAGSPSRVVNVASNYAGGLDLDDLEFRRRKYENHTAYRQSKQANRMLTAAFASLYDADGITVNACHPGVVNSQLTIDMGTRGPDSPDQGADTPVWLASSPEVSGRTGKYFVNRRERADRFMENHEDIERLYSICDSYTDRYL